MKKTDRARRLADTALSYFVIVFGAAVYALSVDYFTAANDIAPGGITGIATMLNHILSTPIGIFTLLLNIPLFIWGAVENGFRFIVRTVVAVGLVSLFIDVFSGFIKPYNGDLIIAAVFGGILSGSGLGLIFIRGGSTGGTDIIAYNLHKRMPHISVGSIVLASDAVVVILSAVVYGSIEHALYAVIAIYVSGKLIDAVVFGMSRDNGKLLMIISAKYEEIAKVIVGKEDRGVTLLSAHGGYSGDSLGVILCALRPHDAARIRSAVLSVDGSAFMITTTATAISGNGFSEKLQ